MGNRLTSLHLMELHYSVPLFHVCTFTYRCYQVGSKSSMCYDTVATHNSPPSVETVQTFLNVGVQ